MTYSALTKDQDLEVDEENTCQVEDKDVLKEIEETKEEQTKKKPELPLSQKSN